jgi:hypothetical protein
LGAMRRQYCEPIPVYRTGRLEIFTFWPANVTEFHTPLSLAHRDGPLIFLPQQRNLNPQNSPPLTMVEKGM